MGEREIARGMTEHILSRIDQANPTRRERGEIVGEQAPRESTEKRELPSAESDRGKVGRA